MNEKTHKDETTQTTPLSRKVLILAGAAAGIIIAGGLTALKNRNKQDAEVAEVESAK